MWNCLWLQFAPVVVRFSGQLFFLYSKEVQLIYNFLLVYNRYAIQYLYSNVIQLYINQPSLCLWNEFNLIMVYDPFYVLLGSVCWDFIEEFYTYIHQRYWSLIFLVVSLSGFGMTGGRNTWRKKDSFFRKWYWENWTDTCKRVKLQHSLTPYTEK